MTTKKDTTDISDPSKFKLEADGSLKRPATVFHNFIEKGGAFEPQAGNQWFHDLLLCGTDSPDCRSLPSLCVVRLPSVFLPLIEMLNLIVISAWAHRTLIVRKLKGLEDIICE
jgi:Glutathione S-transferase, N-terminal domain